MALTKVPYDKDGNLMMQAYHYQMGNGKGTYSPNIPFEAHMTITKHTSSYSGSVKLVLASDDGREFPMFMSDAIKFLKVANLTNGRTDDELIWHVVKRGPAYGLAVFV